MTNRVRVNGQVMTEREKLRWAKAEFLACIAMGKGQVRKGEKSVWNFDLDPLAGWLLTEAIYNL